MQIPVEVSARHVHLSEADCIALFGAGASLTFRKALSQPGEFLSHERVDVVGPKRTLQQVAVLGPLRASTQVEMALTDCRQLGVDAPVRESGDVAGSAPITLVGPAGTVTLAQGLIAAQRHIHMTPQDAHRACVADRQTVRVRVSGKRALTFEAVLVRVSERYALAMHIDTDEANAAGIGAQAVCVEMLGADV